MQAIQQVAAKKRIPDEFKHLSYFGAYDIWRYIDTGDPDNECEHCARFRSYEFTGNQLRQYFPDLTVESENLIYPNVHMTLWGKPTCKCLLIRQTTGLDPSQVVTYEGPKLDPYKPKPKVTIEEVGEI